MNKNGRITVAAPLTSNHAAFTLAEMLVVMLILTIIMAAFAPLMTKRKSVDVTSSPWQWASNNSDTYFGTGDSQTAIIGQSSKDSDDNARLSITPGASNQKHILLKDTSGNNLGKIHVLGTSLEVGSYPDVTQSSTGSTFVGIKAGPGSSSGTYNTAVGYLSGYGMSGAYNTLLGASTGNGISGNHNIVAGYNAGQDVSGGQNILAGQEAGDSIIGSYNIAAGYRAGYKSGSGSSNANYNVAAGYNAGGYTTGSHNIAAGYHAGYYTSGDQNIAIGYQANRYSSGSGNIGIGYQAGGGGTQTSTSGSSNTAVGYQADYNLTTGGYNTAVGYQADYKLTTGNYNTAVGYQAAYNLTTGGNNTAIGYGACKYVTGSNKTCIGANSGPPSGHAWASDSYERIFIGGESSMNGGPAVLEVHNGVPNKALKNSRSTPKSVVVINGMLIVKGGILTSMPHVDDRSFDGQTGYTAIVGNRGDEMEAITTSSYEAVSYYGSSDNGEFYDLKDGKAFAYSSSDKRLKNIKGENKSGLEQIRSLKVYDYTFKKDKEKTPQVGVIAQDLQKVFPTAVKKDEDGYLLIRRDEIFYALVNAVKQLDLLINGVIGELKSAVYRISVHDTEIKKLKKENEELKKQNLNLEKRIERLEKAMN